MGPVAFWRNRGGFVLSVYSACLALRVNLDRGGGRLVCAENEGRTTELPTKCRIAVAKSGIYRPAGVRSDPVTSRRFRIFFLWVDWPFVSIWHMEAGGGPVPETKGGRADYPGRGGFLF